MTKCLCQTCVREIIKNWEGCPEAKRLAPDLKVQECEEYIVYLL